ncbi:MAG: hypothetical protein ABT15_29295 [Pseudonocardia sp. SCN 73-27]|nr:MAG: hypothetical protein ABS80_01580 [Pseudonocardia sp. SCN 72-51]ODV00465.1 MAG: hypothetical protein ABT15_29295 [Pseudonocardia sp. SCN 73-27]
MALVAQLLEKAPPGITSDAVQDDPTVAAIVGGTDVQHAIVAGAGARPVDSNGNPWQGSYITGSGNLLADFSQNAAAEMQGRVQVARLYHMTDPQVHVHAGALGDFGELACGVLLETWVHDDFLLRVPEMHARSPQFRRQHIGSSPSSVNSCSLNAPSSSSKATSAASTRPSGW